MTNSDLERKVKGETMIRELLRDDTNFDGVESSGKKSATRYLVYSCDKGDSTMLLS